MVADAETLDQLLVVLEAMPPARASIQRVPAADEPQLSEHLKFGAAVGEVLAAVSVSKYDDMRVLLNRTWSLLTVIANDANVCLREAAARNTRKTRSRWPWRGPWNDP